MVSRSPGLPTDHLFAGVNGHASAWLETRLGMENRRIRMTPDGPRRDVSLRAVKAAMSLGLKTMGLWQRGLANGLDICYRTVELSVARLPREFDGYRILQISDPHFDAAPALGETIVRAVAGAEVDLCVLTGDFRTVERGAFTQTEILEPLAALCRTVRAADGFLAVLGNHDVADMVGPFERLGLGVLINRAHHVRRGRQTVAVTGLDDVHRYYTPAAGAALSARDPQACGIVLAHSPEMAGEAAAAGHALYLCGHCHGGQVCLPGGRPLIRHLSRHRDLYGGLWRYGDMWGYTSTGAGLSEPPVRFNCRGEVTEFRLRTILKPLPQPE
ncbi:MAG: metallophosphoesterase [Geminicoccaceae bacterium]